MVAKPRGSCWSRSHHLLGYSPGDVYESGQRPRRTGECHWKDARQLVRFRTRRDQPCVHFKSAHDDPGSGQPPIEERSRLSQLRRRPIRSRLHLFSSLLGPPLKYLKLGCVRGRLGIEGSHSNQQLGVCTTDRKKNDFDSGAWRGRSLPQFAARRLTKATPKPR